ncbi:MAG: TonB family protein [Gammaproteobacteria bacterium]|nr:TonB family protein [Gammaproteobacteria bacterium]
MSATNTWDEPFLPWTESANDRRFKRILRVTLIVFTIAGVILTFLPKPAPPAIKDLKEVSPRLAKLIIEQKKTPPPPVPAPEPRPVQKVEKEKPPEPKEPPKEKPRDEPVPKPVPQKNPSQARLKASSSGLLALSNKLNTLQDSFDVKDFSNVPLKKQVASANKTDDTFTKNMITSGATQDSKGIGSKAVATSSAPTRLSERATSSVQSSLNDDSGTATSGKKVSGTTRTESEIARVFEENKGAIYSMYNRALRGDPSLQGKVVLEITIEPDGGVSDCRIVSSDLRNPEFEKKIIARVKLFRFKPGNVRQAIIKYPIDFVPS